MDNQKVSVDQEGKNEVFPSPDFVEGDFSFEEPDDELEEFEEICGNDNIIDPEVADWDELWDTAGWDDEDPNDDFIKLLQEELHAYKVDANL